MRERAIASTNMAAALRERERERERERAITGTITWQHSNIRQKQWQKIMTARVRYEISQGSKDRASGSG